MTNEASPDPVARAAEYRRFLLELLGDDDPAEVQRSGPASWRALVGEAAGDLRRRPDPAGWSVLECLGHAVDAELVSSARYRWILAHDEPPLVGYDQDLWVTRLRHGDDDPAELVSVLEALRSSNLALWARTLPEERARVGMHAERGPESLDLTFRLIAGHDRLHLGQAHRTLAAVRG